MRYQDRLMRLWGAQPRLYYPAALSELLRAAKGERVGKCAGGAAAKDVVQEESVGFGKSLNGGGEQSGGGALLEQRAERQTHVCLHRWGVCAPEEGRLSFQYSVTNH